MKTHIRLLLLALAAALLLSFAGCAAAAAPQAANQTATQTGWAHLDEDGCYTTAEDVCAYLLEYGRLPSN